MKTLIYRFLLLQVIGIRGCATYSHAHGIGVLGVSQKIQGKSASLHFVYKTKSKWWILFILKNAKFLYVLSTLKMYIYTIITANIYN